MTTTTTTNTTIEQEIQAKGLTALRITPADIEANIASEFYFTGEDGVVGHHVKMTNWMRSASCGKAELGYVFTG